jgi:UDP-N-acetylmuramoyl-tripeptide--D-alanyl-D-alanine ligase
VISLNLNDLNNIEGALIISPPSSDTLEKPIRGISIDTRTLQPQDIFWAIRGDSFDGHWFVDEAEKKGAIAAVVEKKKLKQLPPLQISLIQVKDSLKSLQQFSSWYRSKFDIPVVAITGTNGKTTTKEMITWLLQTKFNVHKTIGNLNNHIGTPLTLLGLNSDHQISVIELGTNHPGEIEILSSLVKPSSALITNIGRGHLEFFSSIKGVAKEKLTLFRALKKKGLIFLNRDDKYIEAARIRRKNIQDYSLNEKTKASVKGELTGLDKNGCGIWKLNKKTTIHMQVPGTQNVQNALAASAIALSYGLSENEIKKALNEYSASDKRMQIIKSGQSVIINDAYNANPDSFKPALDTLLYLASAKGTRRVLVVGDMLELGNKSDELHRNLFLNLLDDKIDGIFTYGKACAKALQLINGRGFANAHSFNSHEELAKKLKDYLKPGDIILLKGSRGMQMEKVLAYL